MIRTTIDDMTVDVVGSSASILLVAGDELELVASDVYRTIDGTKVRLTKDDLEATVADAIESKHESRRRVFEILESKVLFNSLPEVKSTPDKHVRDLGNELRWPYMHDIAWMHNLNRKLKHPSLTIETVKMADGWHLVVVLNTAW